jgi:AbrB family looped-hinge helix DNA binding protein
VKDVIYVKYVKEETMPIPTLRKIQRNFMVTIPPSMRQSLGLHEGDVVEFEKTADCIVIRPVEIRRKSALESLDAAMDTEVSDPLASLPEESVMDEVQKEIRLSRAAQSTKVRSTR